MDFRNLKKHTNLERESKNMRKWGLCIWKGKGSHFLVKITFLSKGGGLGVSNLPCSDFLWPCWSWDPFLLRSFIIWGGGSKICLYVMGSFLMLGGSHFPSRDQANPWTHLPQIRYPSDLRKLWPPTRHYNMSMTPFKHRLHIFRVL